MNEFELELRVKEGVRFWVNPNWEKRGLSHGFIGRDIDVRYGNSNWYEWPLVRKSSLSLLRLHQVHGDRIIHFKDLPSEQNETFVGDGDSSIGTLANLRAHNSMLGVTTADCIPVLIWDPSSDLVGAVHCGWRSSVDDLLPKTLHAMAESGGELQSIEVTLGPGAGADYQVGEEVKDAVLASLERCESLSLSTQVISECPDKNRYHLDLRGLLEAQVRSLGVRAETVFLSKISTLNNKDFFSHRREKDLSGRQLSVIGAGSLA